MANRPELSIIIPVLNEAPRIEELLRMLARQEECGFEIILCDGGSTDGSPALTRNLAGALPFNLTLISTPRGRGRQMNAGAARAAGEWLLFLHADSRFPDESALREGLRTLREKTDVRGEELTAGRFVLRFDLPRERATFGYAFCEGKARLGRPGGILGDQGFLLSRELFQNIGPFDESLPVAEDVEFAERLRSRGGRFLLLPAEILTSPRRFEVEGYRPRQTLNAVIMGLLFSGRTDLLSSLRDCYRSHDQGRRLDPEPFFREIAERLSRLPLRERLAFWYRIGAYVRSNAWQLAYLQDVRREWRKGMKGGEEDARMLAWYGRHLDRLTDHPPGRMLTAGLVWGWFNLARRRAWLREGEE